MDNKDLISKIFKTEYSNLVAVLCNFHGLKDIQIAEDIVSDTFMNAMKNWSHNGVPDNPKAWLRKVAANKTIDFYRRTKTYRDKVLPRVKTDNIDSHVLLNFDDLTINDSQLKMIFAVCHPSIGQESQICLALRILSGFGIEEIAIALLSNKENINKKLQRAKVKLRQVDLEINELPIQDLESRLNGVCKILYLIFNEGYYSSINESEIRQDLCWEAMRLTILLTTRSKFDIPLVNALLSLMCFHSSRFDARIDNEGNYILYDQQDRSLWNESLILKGQQYLNKSAQGKVISKYHLEASIAYWHTTELKNKWKNILQLYNKLLMIEYSPIAALNRTYAVAKANSITEAIEEAQKLNLSNNHLYYSLLSELFGLDNNKNKQLEYLDLAIKYAKKENEKRLLQKKKNNLAI